MYKLRNGVLSLIPETPDNPIKTVLFSQLNSEIELYFKMISTEVANVPTELVQTQALACIFSFGALKETTYVDEWIKQNYAYFLVLLEIVKIMEQHDNLH